MSHFHPYNVHSQQCEQCLNLIERTRHRCAAYHDGIPPELWNDEIEHSRPHPDDNGILFELNTLTAMKTRLRALR